MFDLYKTTELIDNSLKLKNPPKDCKTSQTNIDQLDREVFTVPMVNLGK